MDRIALWRGQISVHGHWYCSDMGKPPYRHGDFPYILLFFFVIDRKKEASYN
jgi:hypothetical protein